MTLSNTLIKDESQKAAKLPQYTAAIIANVAGFVVGTCRGWSATSEIPLVEDAEYGFPMSRHEFAWVGSIMVLGCFFGSPLYGWFVTNFGRKRMMMIFNVPATLGYIIITSANNVTVLCIGRFLAGLGVGGYTITIPLYIGEFAEPQIRGKLGMFFQLSNTLGILAVYIIGSFVPVFQLTMFCAVLPAIHGLLVLTFIPESPVYYLEQDKEEEARKSLQWFRGKDYNIEEELAVKKKNVEMIKAENLTLFEAFSTKAARKGLLICIGLLGLRQFCGAGGIIFYNTLLFREAGSGLSPNLQTILLGTVDFLFNLISSMFVDRLGRRPLLFISSIGMAVCTFFIGLFFALKENNYDIHSVTWVPFVFLCAFIIFYSIGAGPLPWVFLGESFPRMIAAFAVSIATCLNYFGAFIVTHYFDDLSTLVGRGGLFFIFSSFSVLGFFFVLFVVIETKNKPLEQIIKELGK